MGLWYEWGGYMGKYEVEEGIFAGKGAGSYREDEVLACTVGLDC